MRASISAVLSMSTTLVSASRARTPIATPTMAMAHRALFIDGARSPDGCTPALQARDRDGPPVERRGVPRDYALPRYGVTSGSAENVCCSHSRREASSG